MLEYLTLTNIIYIDLFLMHTKMKFFLFQSVKSGLYLFLERLLCLSHQVIVLYS